jgi:hypothetical protein
VSICYYVTSREPVDGLLGKSSEIRTENLLLEFSTAPKDTMVMMNKNQLIKV